MSSIVDPIIDAMPQIEEAQNIVMNSLKFRGKSLCEWEKFLEFPPIHPAMSVTEINKFNLRYIIQNIFIMLVLILCSPYLVYLIVKRKISKMFK